jgi:ring-1,2-phenylacetyl-CoA epoxidase subunit PaaD
MVITEKISIERIWKLLEGIPDPELPVLSIVDLGIVRNVQVINDEIYIAVTPTYSGCPATEMINMNIRLGLLQQGYQNVKINTKLSPAWTTNWMNEKAKQKLKNYGIAPPVEKKTRDVIEIKCSQCQSLNTKLISQFGSTACKALYQCNDCKEPFDYFKCH